MEEAQEKHVTCHMAAVLPGEDRDTSKWPASCRQAEEGLLQGRPSEEAEVRNSVPERGPSKGGDSEA